MPAVKTPREYFLEAQPTLMVIEPEQYTPLNMPAEHAMSEGNRVGALVDTYGAELAAKSNIDPRYLDSIYCRSGAYAFCVSEYDTFISVADKDKDEYERIKTEMFDIREKAIKTFSYAYRGPEFSREREAIATIQKGYGIVDLNKDMLSVNTFSVNHKARLEAAKANMAIFDQALALHMRMNEITGKKEISPDQINATKDMCSKAWTWLWEAMEEIFMAGRYVFMDQPAIEELFYVDYLQKMGKKGGKSDTSQPTSAEAAI